MTTSSNTTPDREDSLFPYVPSHILPAIFAAIVGVSLVLHAYQNL
jgi:hypothetical protein